MDIQGVPAAGVIDSGVNITIMGAEPMPNSFECGVVGDGMDRNRESAGVQFRGVGSDVGGSGDGGGAGSGSRGGGDLEETFIVRKRANQKQTHPKCPTPSN